jgi:hypothetical protein
MSGRAHEKLAPPVKWLMEFYHERRGILARYGIEAPLPAAAVELGRRALLAEHPSPPPARRLSLFKQAQRIEGQNADGWILHRIVRNDSRDRAPLGQHSETDASTTH